MTLLTNYHNISYYTLICTFPLLPQRERRSILICANTFASHFYSTICSSLRTEDDAIPSSCQQFLLFLSQMWYWWATALVIVREIFILLLCFQIQQSFALQIRQMCCQIEKPNYGSLMAELHTVHFLASLKANSSACLGKHNIHSGHTHQANNYTPIMALCKHISSFMCVCIYVGIVYQESWSWS